MKQPCAFDAFLCTLALGCGGVGCSEEHFRTTSAENEAGRGDDTGGDADVEWDAGSDASDALDALDAVSETSPSADCGDAGPALANPQKYAPRKWLCLQPSPLELPPGYTRDASPDDSTPQGCPLPDTLRWPGGGELCWWQPVCNVVEQRLSDAGDFECCYDVQELCGV